MAEQLNRTNDFLFKYIFGQKENKDILLSFLNSVLTNNGEDELVDITLSDRELDPEYIGEKMSRLDILGTANDGSIINIEVQLGDERNMDKRTMYYWAKIYQSQLESGMFYKDLKRTVTINILNYDFIPDKEHYYSMYSIYEAETGRRLNKDLEIYFLELKKWKELHSRPKSRLGIWLTYLTTENPEELEEIAMSEPAIRRALTVEEKFLKQDKERYLYEMREKAIRDQLSQMDNAKNEGKAEVALAMIREGMSDEMIRKLTQLPLEQITEIRKKHLN